MKYYISTNGVENPNPFDTFAEVVEKVQQGLVNIGMGDNPLIEELNEMLKRTPDRKTGFTREMLGLELKVRVDR